SCFRRDSRRSAGGQLEHPCDVNSSTTTGPRPPPLGGSRAAPRPPATPAAAADQAAPAAGTSASAAIPRTLNGTFARNITASLATRLSLPFGAASGPSPA